MNNLNNSAEKAERACTTPERMRMVQSIKKSIHRSIQKINPADYKNLLKGQYIFMHLCHKGQIINSEYTKVALFMGAIIMKKAIQKVTAIVTNQPSNKNVKKLSGMGKPVLSVLWLQACFQQKRKVRYQDFLFQQSYQNNQGQEQNQEQISANFDQLLNLYKNHLTVLQKEEKNKENKNCLRFIEKKQKIDRKKLQIILPHQIQLASYQLQRRKSQVISDRVIKKKGQKNKVQIRAQNNQGKKTKTVGSKKSVKNMQKIQNTEKDQQQNEVQKNIKEDTQQKREQKEKKQSKRLNRDVYEKYLKDFNKFQQKLQDNPQQTAPNDQNQNNENDQHVCQQAIPLKLCENQTPFFNAFDIYDNKQQINDQKQYEITTPKKQNTHDNINNDQLIQTYSIKKSRNNNIKVNIIHPILGQKICGINGARKQQDLPLLEMCGNDMRNILWIVSKESKAETMLAILSKPKSMVTEQFLLLLQKSPTTQITQKLLSKYQIRCRLNLDAIRNRNIVLLDSVIGCSSLQKVIKYCEGNILNKVDFLFNKMKVDFVVTNRKKGYIKSDKDTYRLMTQADFIDSILIFDP